MMFGLRVGKLAVLAALAVPMTAAAQSGSMILATTTSVRDAGLLAELLPPFERVTGISVRVLAVGSGRAMELGRGGEADLLILHDPAGELDFVSQGYGVTRLPLMHNEFVVVGPPDDPANIRGSASVVESFRDIAARGQRFVSRDDQSGTHVRELAIWGWSGVTPSGSWYLMSGQGIGASLQIAHELGAYTLTDLSSFLAHAAPLELDVLVLGDTLLVNRYHIVRPNPERFSWINVAAADALVEYLLSPETQARIARFGVARYGKPLFVPHSAPDAAGNPGH